MIYMPSQKENGPSSSTVRFITWLRRPENIKDENDHNYVEPDISIICDPNKLNDKGCTGAPDWIIEIVSPGSRQMDYSTKLFKYRTAGVREYWIVDPEKNRITVYDFPQDGMDEYSFSDDVPVCIYPRFSLNLSKLNI